mmetsp:Transcript_8562/g.18109  ORF Transcript_8562/g.18109 Transcript_8562/m.18109 type:complete len:233 (-) Transcript_8562:1566-2264(-)
MLNLREFGVSLRGQGPVSDNHTNIGVEVDAAGLNEYSYLNLDVKKRNAAFKGSVMELEESKNVEAEPKKKTKKSILEKLNYEDNDDGNAGVNGTINYDATKERDNFKIAASIPNIAKAENEPKMKAVPDLNSLSTKQDVEASSHGCVHAKVTAKKKMRNTAKSKYFSVINEAKPICVVFNGNGKNSAIMIKNHRVEEKFDLGEEPLVLTRKYDRRSKIHIERFLSGFGTYLR